MKFQADQFATAITAYGPDWITVAGERIEYSVVIDSSGERSPWDCSRFDELSDAHFAPLADSRPELILFGSGQTLRFPRPAWIRSLYQAGIGVETMDLGAACRTYNILASEGRRVLAALLIEPGAASENVVK